MTMCKVPAITSEANREHDTHKKTQVSQQQGQLNGGLLHNAAVIVFTGQTCCNSEEPKRVWRSVYSGPIGRKKLKMEAATSSTTNPTRTALALNSGTHRPLPSVQCYEDCLKTLLPPRPVLHHCWSILRMRSNTAGIRKTRHLMDGSD